MLSMKYSVAIRWSFCKYLKWLFSLISEMSVFPGNETPQLFLKLAETPLCDSLNCKLIVIIAKLYFNYLELVKM